jgi:hypothetical protein
MQQDAVDCASQALEKYNIEKVIGTPKEFRKKLSISMDVYFLYHLNYRCDFFLKNICFVRGKISY